MKTEIISSKVNFVEVTEASEGQRIDNYLTKLLKGVPKTHIYKVLRKGEVRVNKKRTKANYKLALGDRVRIPPIKLNAVDKPSVKLNQVQQLEQAIIYESDRIIVVNKPSGMAVHGGSGLNYGVIEALRQLRPDAPFLELVHRLDRDTSGCLLVAKKRSALRLLHEQLRDKNMDKRYQALVVGRWPKRKKLVNLPLKKNELKSGERIVTVDESGKDAQTRYQVIDNKQGCTLIEASPITGRTHQIRVHCQASEHAIIGDSKYCDDDINQHFSKKGIKRLMLHAYAISFTERQGGELIKVEAPWPSHLDKLLKTL